MCKNVLKHILTNQYAMQKSQHTFAHLAFADTKIPNKKLKKLEINEVIDEHQ